jgi:FMN reductase
MSPVHPVTVVGLGGSLRADSQSGRALDVALAGAEQAGAGVRAISGDELVLPFYDPEEPARTELARALVSALRGADGVVLVSPGYHGTVSGLLKNALDYVEDLRDEPRPYLDARAVGCVAVASGWQATVNTLGTLRSVTHALRGWPTPLGVSVNSAEAVFDTDGTCSDETVTDSLSLLGRQVAEFARRWN